MYETDRLCVHRIHKVSTLKSCVCVSAIELRHGDFLLSYARQFCISLNVWVWWVLRIGILKIVYIYIEKRWTARHTLRIRFFLK